MSIGLALAAAFVWGTGDFLGGFATRRAPLLTVMLVSQGVGLAGMAVAAAIAGGTVTPADLGFGALAGVAGGAGVAMLYRGLAGGTMSLVSPITGVIAVVVPVVAGVLFGERPAAVQYGGIAVAVIAVALLSGGPRQRRLDRRSLVLAIGAGIGFGIFFVALARTSAAANLWPVVAARGASVTALVLLSAALRRAPRVTPADARVVVGAGVLDVAANALYLVAVHGGLLSIVAVLASLYPVATVLCSLLFLGERLRSAQLAGVAAALGAVVLITAF
ncbi:MAG: EamA family transporter [Candidatus Dormibacteraeota bacterium]|nr:EamA family transporter [Candidatus Dormibacteraeota bacterium]